MKMLMMEMRSVMWMLLATAACYIGTCGAVRGDVLDDAPMASNASAVDQPVFVLEPEEHYYIVKGKAVTVTCKALHALQMTFNCAGHLVRSKHQVDTYLREPDTPAGAPEVMSLQSSINIEKEDVDRHTGEAEGEDGYECECHAWSSSPDKFTVSRRGLIQLSNLKKTFDREPMNTLAEAGSSVQLQCLPPQGVPTPEVFWLKDGVQVDVKQEPNFILSSEGNLIINQVRLADMGNYSCGAQNPSGRRISEPATVTVYVNGGWGAWSPWIGCVRCSRGGYQQRSRTCTRPAPVNNGAPCAGEASQRAPCVCAVDGGWSDWTDWSECDVTCRSHRQRTCTSPAPQNGGRECEGLGLDLRNCTGGMCQRSPSLNDATSHGPRNEQKPVFTSRAEDHVAVYAGLCAALAFFITIIVIVTCLLRSKRCVNGCNEKLCDKDSHELVQPDIMQNVVTIENRNVYDEPRDVYVNQAEELSAAASDHSPNTEKSLLLETVTECDTSIAARRSLGDASSRHSSTAGYRTGDSPPLGRAFDTLPLLPHRSSVSASAPAPLEGRHPTGPPIDADASVCARMTSAGGRITLPNSGVCLTIPEGALEEGPGEDIFVAVCREDRDRPRLTDSQTLLGPVVLCGPPNVVLLKPAIVTFQHCASVKHGQWALDVHTSQAPPGDLPDWQAESSVGHATADARLCIQVDVDQCHIMTSRLCRYALVGRPFNPSSRPIKLLWLAAFAPPVPASSIDHNIRVYLVDNTLEALECALKVEDNLGGRLLDQPRQMGFQYGGGNMCVTIDQLGPGWRCKLGAAYQEIPFSHVWSSQSGLHCSFVLEHVDRLQTHLDCHMLVHQMALASNRQTIRISCALPEKIHPSAYHISRSSLSSQTSLYQSTPRHVTRNTLTHAPPSVEPPHVAFRMPSNVKVALCDMLDPPSHLGNNWQMLAQRLNVDRYMSYFGTMHSPTEHLLNLWEARQRDSDGGQAMAELTDTLRIMGRADAAGLLESEMAHWI